MNFPGNLQREPIAKADFVTMPWLLFLQNLTAAVDTVIVTFHSQRPNYSARNYAIGSMLYETDRSALYINFQHTWVWIAGEMAGTLSPDEKPADLSENDSGFRFRSTDFFHVYRWTGSAWTWADPGDPSGRIADSAVALGSGWKLMDGTGNPVTYATATGGTATITLPDETGAYHKGGTWDGAVNAATGGTVTGTTNNVSAGTPSGSVSSISSTGSAGTVVQSGLGTTVASQGHTHSAPSFTGSALTGHDHTVSGTSTGSEPKNIKVYRYFRI